MSLEGFFETKIGSLSGKKLKISPHVLFRVCTSFFEFHYMPNLLENRSLKENLTTFETIETRDGLDENRQFNWKN